MRMIARLTALTAMLSLSLACGSKELQDHDSSTTPTHGGTVVVGVASDLQNWNPYLDTTQFGDDILRLLYPSLAIEQTDFRDHPPTFAPNLARDWSWSEDHMVLTVHLDESAVWSDGVPVTTDDVLFTWEIQQSEDIGWTGIYVKDAIQNIEATDTHTVVYTFDRLYPYQLMDAVEGVIVPAHVWKEIPTETWLETDWAANALSAGPFVFESYTPQQEIVFKRNPNFWKENLPYLDRVVWRIVPSQASLVTQLLAGDLDLVDVIPARDAERVAADAAVELIQNPDRGYGYLGWNNHHPVFSDPEVRRAMTLAIDRETIVDNVFQGRSGPSLGPVLSDMWAFNDELKPSPYTPEKAREMLSAAGWTDTDDDGIIDRDGESLSFNLMTNSENQTRKDIAVLVRDQLALVGVEANLDFVDWGTMVQRQASGDFDAFIGSWIESTFIDLQDTWHSAADDEPTYNYVRYSNPEVDRLIVEMNEMGTFEKQKPIIDQLQLLIVDDHPYTFLYERTQISGLNRRVRGADVNEISAYFNISQWFVAGSK